MLKRLVVCLTQCETISGPEIGLQGRPFLRLSISVRLSQRVSKFAVVTPYPTLALRRSGSRDAELLTSQAASVTSHIDLTGAQRDD